MFSERVKLLGRIFEKDGSLLLKDSYTGISFYCRGSVRLTITPEKETDKDSCPYVGVVVDDNLVAVRKIAVTNELKNIEVIKGDGKLHKIDIVKLTEEQYGNLYFSGLSFGDEDSVKKTESYTKSILFIGDSITAGYGVDGLDGRGDFTTFEENVLNSAAILTAKKIKAEVYVFASSGNGIISRWIEPEKDEPNEDGLIPVIFPFENEIFPEPDYISINLGTNDNSYIKGKPEHIRRFKEEYTKFIVKLRKLYPKSKIFIAFGIMEDNLLPAIGDMLNNYKNQYGDEDCVLIKLDKQQASEGIGAAGHPSLNVNKRVSECIVRVIEKNII